MDATLLMKLDLQLDHLEQLQTLQQQQMDLLRSQLQELHDMLLQQGQVNGNQSQINHGVQRLLIQADQAVQSLNGRLNAIETLILATSYDAISPPERLM